MVVLAIVMLIVGLVLGLALAVILLRFLGRRAKTSAVASEVFHWLTKYRARVYTIHRVPQDVVVKVYGDEDSADLQDIIKNFGFSAEQAKEAAKHVGKTASGKTLEVKVKEALQYLDKESHYESVSVGR